MTQENGQDRKDLKIRLPTIKSLAMLKMEKNFIAYVEKGYPRQPYIQYPINIWIRRIKDELYEFIKASNENDIIGMKEELADISNIVDYMFEVLEQHAKQ
jgi:NTP pyrophosphatase (non-canonical NTP hydrolase)